ncbi:hypothetical protein B0J11DRAFT_584759 [Dendryphion nanum]|uniref:Rhodopsin domain-containing protein n=1 Tax=Dendryphion nanum TaxID=256645 RepID=A0A9P9D7V4_9PLEO|nr:hypothetical protein B0J11DRAFT_584759 [Dendryphion nanum]
MQDMFPGVDLCLIPAGVAPDGRPPNFVDPPSLQPAVISITAVMLALAFVVLAGRLFVNRKSLKISDWMMVVGFIFDAGLMGSFLTLSDRYLHQWDIPLCRLLGNYMKLHFANDIITGPALFFPKVAIFLFYMQVFSSAKTVRVGSIVGIVMAFMAYFPASLVLSYWNAPHVGQSWDELILSGMTHKGVPGAITIGVASVIVDIYIFVLPLPTLARLNMPLARRVQVMSLFATAFLGVVASVVCLAYRIKLLWLTDGTWQAGVIAIPIIIENNVAIIVGSLPAFASFMRKYVAESSIYKSFRSILYTSSNDSKDDWQQKADLETIGSSGKQRKFPSYYGKSDDTTLQSQITVPDDCHVAGSKIEGYEYGIMRTVAFNQQEHNRSEDRLV